MMVNGHFESNLSQQGRTDANFNFVFSDQPQVAEYAARFAEVIDEDAGLHRPIPGQWLHCTVVWLGALADFSREELLEAAALMEPKLQALELPQFILGQWWVDSGNVLVHLTPRDPLKQVYNIVYEAMEEVVGPRRMPARKSFMPHITLAYSRPKSYADELTLHRRLATVKAPCVELHLQSLSLLEQYIQEDHYAWRVVRVLSIRQATE